MHDSYKITAQFLLNTCVPKGPKRIYRSFLWKGGYNTKGASDGLVAIIHESWAQLRHPGLRKIQQDAIAPLALVWLDN
jgi:hypothetical protein